MSTPLPAVRTAQGQGLTPADELLCHQTADTFATVSQSDLSWTEKIWAVVSRRDGSLQVDTGMGRYHNRGVLDGFGGLSRGREQWVVRASRDLWPDPQSTSAGPLSYEVLEPMQSVRFRLQDNDISSLRFDIVLEATMPAALEQRDHKRDDSGMRVTSDLLRYHQFASPRGWVELDGERQVVEPETWFGVRDHSWGIRGDVGTPPADLRPGHDAAQLPIQYSWSPLLFTRPDGSTYELHHYVQQLGEYVYFSSGHLLEHDGRLTPVTVRPDLTFHPSTRRLTGGHLLVGLPDGSLRKVVLEVVGETGFHLGLGHYLGLDGHHHGQWRGALHVDAEHVADATEPSVVRRIHQLRDCIVRATDGDASGIGVHETLVGGSWPDRGLDPDTAFL